MSVYLKKTFSVEVEVNARLSQRTIFVEFAPLHTPTPHNTTQHNQKKQDTFARVYLRLEMRVVLSKHKILNHKSSRLVKGS